MSGIFDIFGSHLNPLSFQQFSLEYKQLAQIWSHYPAYYKINDILKAINDYQLLFIISGTGSGKTVLIPKFALHYLNYSQKIAITLPKRILVLSAATYAAKTLDVELGNQVGYVYKGSDKKMLNPENKLIYMTDGYLLMKLTQDPLLSDYKIIIIDEAHERRVSIDLLLLFLKKLLTKRSDLKVIIMSATINGSKYQNYFNPINNTIINISGQPNYPIETHFLEKPKPYISEGLKIIKNLIPLNKDILFFITTSNEAIQLCKEIINPKIYCIEVYADMDPNLKIYAETNKFLELGDYKEKIIIATNVAESSLTINNLTYVIDSGYELYSYFDPKYYGKILKKRLISQAQVLQRRGRVGRTQPGISYLLLTKDQFNSLQKYPEPDILKQDITIDILKIFQISDINPKKFLNELMDPPKPEFIDISYKLFKMYNLVIDDKLTKLGYDITKFSSLPLNRILFLIYSYQLYCAKEASIILAMLDTKIIFNHEIFDKKSDHLTLLEMYLNNPIKQLKNSINQYYHKIIKCNAPQLSRVINIDIKKRIIQALKQSHKHLIAKNLISKFNAKGEINRKSVVYYTYSQKELSKKKFIYDEFINLNNKWEFNIITLWN